ncbi:hypothetical protein EDC44_1485 [Cricetibacter osteomyelitidis]|uniref:Uncharacterized protein n=1 Tax=Cricetibacter osteomyelitidis TaxID=1521931 RepID=A0A4R2SGP1_9PAST|nr:hypothetical protein EDC44_1485 [Cricetibacter osteomyelitidis]
MFVFELSLKFSTGKTENEANSNTIGEFDNAECAKFKYSPSD